ncbi:unnamed protein product [Brassica napus]|uniref:(rape) hypothetical protein n=1 Tax=Brassica napus TaxID=3708 RepID=A0A816UMQ1_BRANA|nr:unnamed protein product [Brassica napus]
MWSSPLNTSYASITTSATTPEQTCYIFNIAKYLVVTNRIGEFDSKTAGFAPLDMSHSDPYIYIYIYIYIYDVYFKLRYRVEMAIADDTAERTFVRFDGAEDGVNPDDSRIPSFIADMEGKSYTFQLRVTAYNFTSNHKTLIFSIVDELGRVRDDDVDDNGGNEDDDDNMPNGKPAPVGFASGRATGNRSDGSIRYCA